MLTKHLRWSDDKRQEFEGHRLELGDVGAVSRCIPGKASKDELTHGKRSPGLSPGPAFQGWPLWCEDGLGASKVRLGDIAGPPSASRRFILGTFLVAPSRFGWSRKHQGLPGERIARAGVTDSRGLRDARMLGSVTLCSDW